MAELNLIKTRQLDLTDFGTYITGLVTGSFGSFLSQYLANDGSLGSTVVYTTGLSQLISGQKTFALSPSIPYSGTSGQAISKLYVDTITSPLTSGINDLLGSKFVYQTGDQNISGNKTFFGQLRTDNIYSQSGNLVLQVGDYRALDSNFNLRIDWNSLDLLGSWKLNYESIVTTESAQTINGVKTFTGGAKVPTTTNFDYAIPYGQFQSEVTSLRQEFVDAVNTISTGESSGFAGVLGINKASGYIFTQGRGTVTVWQQGNILNISGAGVSGVNASKAFGINKVFLSSGNSSYSITLTGYTSTPFVLAQLGTDLSSNENVPYIISNVTTSSFNIEFADVLANTGYYVNYMAVDGTGLLSLLKGEQGLIGASINPRGTWISGTTYGFLDWTNINGVSWASTQTHASSPFNSPTGISGSSYWQLLASGSGPKGDSATLFDYKGYWDESLNYFSGEGVSYNGATYGTLSLALAGQNPVSGSPWYLLTDKGEQGDGFFYKGEFSTTTSYTKGDVVYRNGASYIYSGDAAINGNKYNPLSIVSPWSLLQEKSLTYTSPYSAQKIYYKNDLAGTNTGFNSDESIQYVNTAEYPLKSLHPYGYYNIFLDCDNFTGNNLFIVKTGIKDYYHPYYGVGNATGIILNNNTINEEASGFGTLTLIRGQKYYFDSELTNVPLIITTNATGNGYNGQTVTNVFVGPRLSVVDANYLPMGLNQSMYSGTMLFIPSSVHPDILYYQSSASAGMGWKLKLVDQNPWSVFSSGVIGKTGVSGSKGDKGDQGLAFAWKGNWSAVVSYNSGDAVFHSGSSYGTKYSVIATQPPFAPWEMVAQKGDAGKDARGLAFVWKGNWSSTVGYVPNDAVYYNGASYATTGSPSGNFPPDIFTASWFTVAKSGAIGPQGSAGSAGIAFGWLGDYSDATTYSSGQAVYYNGSSYGMTGAGTSLGVKPDYTGANKWSLFARAGGTLFSWRGEWSPAANYLSGEAVFKDGSSYGCSANNFNSDPVNGTPWFLVSQKGDQGDRGLTGPIGPQGSGGLAFSWKGTWSGGTSYLVKESVYYNGSSYGTLYNITGSVTTLNPEVNPYWFLIAKKGDQGLAFSWKGTWDSGVFYRPNDSVYYNGSSYATTAFIGTGIRPTSSPWFVVAQKGGTDFQKTLFLPTYSTGNGVIEEFTSKDFIFTGFVLGVATPSTVGSTISGSIYKRSTSNSKTNLTTFEIPVGLIFSGNSGFNTTVPIHNRVGIDISGGAGTDAARISVGVFGYSV